jgi:hypothetical protein
MEDGKGANSHLEKNTDALPFPSSFKGFPIAQGPAVAFVIESLKRQINESETLPTQIRTAKN